MKFLAVAFDVRHSLILCAIACAIGLSAPTVSRAAAEVGSVGGDSSGSAASTHRPTGPEVSASAVSETSSDDDGWNANGFSMNYTNILYGPSLGDTSSYQPTSEGNADPDRPVFMKNFLSASYGFAEKWAVTGTAYWWHRPVLGQEFTMQDPFIRVSNASVYSTRWGLNFYSDFRVHPGITDASREADRLFGVQSFNYVSYQPNYGRFLAAIRASARYNQYGRHGVGTDAEFYLAPEMNYRINRKLAVTLLYEMGSSHQFGDDATYFTNDGTDLEPGIEWNPTPSIVVNPYLTILTGGKVSLASTSFGMFFTWNFL
jgi:hypothetical protein